MNSRAAFCLLIAAAPVLADETITRGNNLAVDAASDGRLVMDLAGAVWTVPHAGGVAEKITDVPGKARHPRWSPDGTRVLFSTNHDGKQQLQILTLASEQADVVGSTAWLDLDAAWHPGGERIVFASDRRDSGFDIWEADLATGLEWRISSRPGDETQPAWSADGRDLVYVHREDNTWSLILRRLGEPEEILVSGEERLAGPSWRPDGSMIVFWRELADGPALDMIILSTPRLVRRYMDGEDYTTVPVSWPDRHRMVYSAGGVIRQRLFNAWSSRTVPFRATIQSRPEIVVEKLRRSLPRIDEPQGTLIIHAARLYDGLGGGYQTNRDIVIEGGRIAAVEPHQDRPGRIVIDMGDLAVLPGLVDAHARLPDGADESTGPLLLAAGVTTVIAEHEEAEHLNAVWSGKDVPGPRLLPATEWEVAKVSNIADSTTPGLDSVLQSRAADLVGFDAPVARRFSEPQRIEYGRTDVVLGSRNNGMPAGIGTQAELRALTAAGLKPNQALHAAGVNAAAALGVDPTLGRVATGAVADLILVDGDPLSNAGDALNIVAVVRNGRFYSVAGLIDRAAAAKSVE